MEGWPSVEGGDKLLSQVNMTTIEKLGQDAVIEPTQIGNEGVPNAA
jgi:hypothetical protein